MTNSPDCSDLAIRASCGDPHMQCMRQWFEMEAVDLAAGTALCGLRERPGPLTLLRSRLLFAVGDGRTSLGDLQALYEAGRRAPELDVAALACAAMIDAVLAAGCDFDRLDGLAAQVDSLLAEDEVLSVHAQAALLLRRGLISLVREADIVRAGKAFDEGIRLVEGRVSEPLLLAHRALRGVTDCLTGNLTRADVGLADARFLCQQAGVGARPRLLVEGSLGLVRLFLGEAADAYFILTGACRSSGFGALSPGMQLLMLCHRLYAAADFGLAEEVKDLAQHIGFRAIPGHQALLHAYRHFALGAVALRAGDALRALIHAEECMRSGELAGARLPVTLVALLQAQALSDLRRSHEVRALLADWVPRWIAGGLLRVAAVGRLELAMLDARSGELDRARHHLVAARALLPAGESLRPVHRGGAWLDELNGMLAAGPAGCVASAPHVSIRTLGEFVVEVGGRRIYDRDWKGARTKSLLIALICEGGQKVPADHLADLLWPDSDGAQALQNLKVALHRLRRLGCEGAEAPVNWVHVKHGLVSLPGSLCRVDVHELVQAVQAGLKAPHAEDEACREVLALCAGEFLPGLHPTPPVARYRKTLHGLLDRLIKRFPVLGAALADARGAASKRSESGAAG